MTLDFLIGLPADLVAELLALLATGGIDAALDFCRILNIPLLIP